MSGEQIQDPQGQSTTTDPSKGDDGESTTIETQTQDIDNLPEQFKGKTAAEIAKSYIELQKLQGKHSKEVSEVRTQLQQWEKLGKFLESRPDLYKQIEDAIKGGSEQKTDTTENDQAPKLKEVRLTQENTILNEFEKDFGIISLQTEKREDLHKKIAQELADMLDPGGTKSVREVIDGIPLPRLRQYLEKAYKLATSSDREERARLEALLEKRQNQEGSFGTFPSSSVGNKAGQLTEEERKVAKRMGLSDEEYLKNKDK
jgi:hypothetical protein